MLAYHKYKSLVLLVLIGGLYGIFGYSLNRTDFIELLVLYIALCTLSYILYQQEKVNLGILIGASFVFRLIFLFAIPNLSQDFYRFIWDGRMVLEGLNPYLTLPETFIQEGNSPISQAKDLYEGMGKLNGGNHTNYPPINQLNFAIASLFSDTTILASVIGLRVQIILADLGILFFGLKIVKHLRLPKRNILFYLLNPFIIIELTGNLHFEAVMLFFLVWSIHLLVQKKWIWSAVTLGCAVSVKLIPLILVPLFFHWFYRNKNWYQIGKFTFFGAIVILVNLLLFLPFISSVFIENYLNSVGLWFSKFEFNASIYYLLRELGYGLTGYNQIEIIGRVLSVCTLLMVLSFSIFRKNDQPKKLLETMLLVLTCYYFLSTTVHPWYLASLVLFSVFTRFKYPLFWGLVVILSYQVYSNMPWSENLWLVTAEYLLVLGVFIFELKNQNQRYFDAHDSQ